MSNRCVSAGTKITQKYQGKKWITVVAGGPGNLIYQAAESIGWALAWGIPVGLLVFVLPLAFVSGLYLIFHSSVWNQVSSAQDWPPHKAR
jgi:hypothetical protein